MNNLSEKSSQVLLAVTKDFIKNAKPVSSRRLKNSHGFKFSSATIRNLMADLAEQGYLMQPHTSAGRVPTVKGYRYYVDSICKRISLDLAQRRFIIDHFSKEENEHDGLLKRTCRFMAHMTTYLGVALRYSYSELKIKHIDLIVMKNSQILVVIITSNGEVMKERVHVRKFDFDINKLEKVMNKEFIGLNWRLVIDKMKHLRDLGLFGQIFEEITHSFINLAEKQRTTLFYDGLSNLINFPELFKIKNISGIFYAIEEDTSTLKEISTKFASNTSYIAIGDELKSSLIGDISLVLAPYRVNSQLAGAVGIIGPMRMDYEMAIGTSTCVAGNLESALKNEN